MAGSKSEVIKSLVVNLVIAASKGVGAAITGSGAMLAETLHSFADCGNQLLLLFGIFMEPLPGVTILVPILAPIAAALGIDPPADWFVFADLRKDPTGQTPMRPDWLSGAWTRHRARHGAVSVRLHHLRHWHLSTLGAAGVPGANLQRRGGHADLSTTGIYTHALEAGEDVADGVIERALAAPKRKARRVVMRRP